MKWGFIDFIGEFRTYDTLQELMDAAERDAGMGDITIELWQTFGRVVPDSARDAMAHFGLDA